MRQLSAWSSSAWGSWFTSTAGSHRTWTDKRAPRHPEGTRSPYVFHTVYHQRQHPHYHAATNIARHSSTARGLTSPPHSWFSLCTLVYASLSSSPIPLSPFRIVPRLVALVGFSCIMARVFVIIPRVGIAGARGKLCDLSPFSVVLFQFMGLSYLGNASVVMRRRVWNDADKIGKRNEETRRPHPESSWRSGTAYLRYSYICSRGTSEMYP